MTQLYKLTFNPLFCHAFNGNLTQLAVSANSNAVFIYAIPPNPRADNNYQLLATLDQHVDIVTGLDWAPKSNCIVSCSTDLNSFVWNQQSDGSWKQTLVYLQIFHAAICVSWSPLENKFAVGSSSKILTICYFDKENNWWVAKPIKKGIQSTVTAIDWHPDNILIACGCSDFKVRVYSANLDKNDNTVSNGSNAWGDSLTFGKLLYKASSATGSFSRGGWVHSVQFSSDGQSLAWVGHDSTITVASVSGTAGTSPAVSVLRHAFLPFTSLTWVGKSSLVAAGHDCTPMLFRYADGQLEFKANLDPSDRSLANPASGAGPNSNPADGDDTGVKVSAMSMFKSMDTFNLKKNSSLSALNDAIHLNTINEIRIFKGNRSEAHSVSTIGRDGNLVIWDLKSLSSKLGKLTIN